MSFLRINWCRKSSVMILTVLLIVFNRSVSYAEIKNDSPENLIGAYNYPGGIAQIRLPKLSSHLPIVKFGLAEPPIIESQDHWTILVGLSLTILPGEYLLWVKQSINDLPASSFKFKVEQKFYPVEDFDGLRSSTQPKQINHDKFSDIDFENTEQPSVPLELPINGTWVDAFGTVAAIEEPLSDNTEVQIHNYVYHRSTKLSVITAPQNAIVSRIIQGPEPEALATVFLDHGRGVYSVLSGVADLSVEPGNGIIAGAIIGKLPLSENTEKPATLIWQSIVNGVYVNPLILTELR